MGGRLICKQVKTQLYIFVFFILFLVLFPICFALCIPIYMIRFIVAMARKLSRPDLGKMISTRSAVIAVDNPSHSPKWNLCVWLTLEGNLDFEQFRHNFLHDIVLKKNSKGDLASPEYQQYFYKWIGFLFWKWEQLFDIQEHMKYYFDQTSSDNLHQVTTEEELRQVIKELTAKPFPERKSPWEFLFIPDFLESEDNHTAPKKSILIFRVHHGFCDGYAILSLLLKELNKVGMESVAKPVKIKKTFLSRLLKGAFFWIRAPYDFMELMVKSKDSNKWHLPQNTLERPFNTAFTPRIQLSNIKEIKNGNNVSFTTVILEALTGGLRKVMINQGVKVPTKFTTAVAVPMPRHPEKLRNHFIFSFMSLPIGISDPMQRLAKIEKNYQKLKRSPVTGFSFMMVPVFGGLFTWMIDWFSNNKFSTVLTSNFPGPGQAELHFIAGGSNNKVLDMNFSAGMGVGNVGIGFCMLSFAEGMRIITTVDKSILPTDAAVEELNRHILEELEILKQLQWAHE